MWTSAPEVMDLDTTLAKSRADGQTLPLPPVKWTWMTWSIEALFEYCRIAWDIVPHFKVSLYSLSQQCGPRLAGAKVREISKIALSSYGGGGGQLLR